MKPSPATLLILTMFGSFAVILTAMIVLFRTEPGPAPRRTGPVRPPTERPASRVDSGSLNLASQTVPEPSGKQEPQRRLEKPPPPPVPSRAPSADRRLQKELERERKEMALLKTDMEKRLKRQLALRERKLTQFARQCEGLEPGEAAQILLELDDETLAEILRRMNRNRALPISALLKRLGREKAIPVQ